MTAKAGPASFLLTDLHRAAVNHLIAILKELLLYKDSQLVVVETAAAVRLGPAPAAASIGEAVGESGGLAALFQQLLRLSEMPAYSTVVLRLFLEAAQRSLHSRAIFGFQLEPKQTVLGAVLAHAQKLVHSHSDQLATWLLVLRQLLENGDGIKLLQDSHLVSAATAARADGAPEASWSCVQPLLRLVTDSLLLDSPRSELVTETQLQCFELLRAILSDGTLVTMPETTRLIDMVLDSLQDQPTTTTPTTADTGPSRPQQMMQALQPLLRRPKGIVILHSKGLLQRCAASAFANKMKDDAVSVGRENISAEVSLHFSLLPFLYGLG